jgi:hypothetical protein
MDRQKSLRKKHLDEVQKFAIIENVITREKRTGGWRNNSNIKFFFYGLWFYAFVVVSCLDGNCGAPSKSVVTISKRSIEQQKKGEEGIKILSGCDTD